MSRFKSAFVRTNSGILKGGKTIVRVSSSVGLNTSSKRSRPLTISAMPKTIQYIPVTLEKAVVIPKRRASSKQGINFKRAVRRLASRRSGTSSKRIKTADSRIYAGPPPETTAKGGVMWKTTYAQPTARFTARNSVPVAKPTFNLNFTTMVIPTPKAASLKSVAKPTVDVSVKPRVIPTPQSSYKPMVNPSETFKLTPSRTKVKQTNVPSKVIVNVITNPTCDRAHSPHSRNHGTSSGLYMAARSPHTTRICTRHQPKAVAVLKAKDSKKTVTTQTERFAVMPKNRTSCCSSSRTRSGS